MDTIARAVNEDERRALRDEWRRAGRSQRRPLKSFMTTAEKQERRQEHAARIAACREWLGTEEGIREWLVSRELNPDVSPLNQALAAYQAPREVIGTQAQWKRSGYRIQRGASASLYLTASGFWPKPAFTAAQTDAPAELVELEPRVPLAELVGDLRSVYAEAMAAGGAKPAMAKLLEACPAIIPAETEPAAPSAMDGSDDLPF